MKVKGDVARGCAVGRLTAAKARSGDIDRALAIAQGLDGFVQDRGLSGAAETLAKNGDVERAQALASSIKGEDKKAYALTSVARAMAEAGNSPRALATARGALASVEAFHDVGLGDYTADLLTEVAETFAMAGDLGTAREVAGRAHKTAEAIERADARVIALGKTSVVLAKVGLNDLALDIWRSAIKRARYLDRVSALRVFGLGARVLELSVGATEVAGLFRVLIEADSVN